MNNSRKFVSGLKGPNSLQCTDSNEIFKFLVFGNNLNSFVGGESMYGLSIISFETKGKFPICLTSISDTILDVIFLSTTQDFLGMNPDFNLIPGYSVLNFLFISSTNNRSDSSEGIFSILVDSLKGSGIDNNLLILI